MKEKLLIQIKREKKSIGFKFDKGSEFSYGIAGVKEGNTYKIINQKGKTLVEKEDGVLSPLNNNLIRYEKLANEILTNENTTEAIESLAQSGKTLKTTGILNTKGEVIVEPGRYDEIIKDIGEGYILVKKNKMYGLLNAEGNEIIPCEYTSIGEINEDSFLYQRVTFVEHLMKKEKLQCQQNISMLDL